MVRRPARFLAPIALAATITATYLVVHDTLSTTRATTPAHVVRLRPRAHGKFAKSTFYVVQRGDSMTSIAAKTGISLAALEALNPNVDPNALQTSQRLRLRR